MSQYSIRLAVREDLPAIYSVYSDARAFMKATGNPNQWGDNKPLPALVENDIEKKQSYVLCDEEGKIKGIFAFILGEDPTYTEIYDGRWLNDRPYGTIHRIAGAAGAHGILEATLEYCKTQIDNLRIDTHEENKVMQHQVLKYGFTYCGIIHLENGDPRLAYQMDCR